mgnify:FL=1
MKNLLEIVRVLTKKKLARIEILDENTLKTKGSKFGQLYEALVTGKIENDRDAVRLLYGSADVSSDKYRQFKSRFKRRLYNSLFFADINEPLASNRAQAHLNCHKDWAQVCIMLAYQMYGPAVAQAKNILSTARKYHFTDLVVACARLLRDRAAANGQPKKFDTWHAIVEAYLPLLETEARSESLCQQAILVHKARYLDQAQLQQLEAISEELLQLNAGGTSPIVQYHLSVSWILYYEATREHSNILEIATQALQYMDEQPDYFTADQRVFFLIRQLSVHLHRQQYSEGRRHTESMLDSFAKGSSEWLDFMEYYFLLSLHTSNYINAVAVFNQVADTPSYKKMTGTRQEKWTLFEAFLHYFVEQDHIKADMLLRGRRRVFKTNDFLNEAVHYSTPLANIALHRLVLQMLFNLNRRNVTGFQKATWLLEKLVAYEFKKKGFERALALSKLILALEKNDYQPQQIPNLEKLLQSFAQYDFFYRGKIAELEVVPFDKLWEILCHSLE